MSSDSPSRYNNFKSHYKHFDTETFLCCRIREGPLSHVFLADRLRRLQRLSQINFVLALLCLVVVGANCVLLIMNGLQIHRVPVDMQQGDQQSQQVTTQTLLQSYGLKLAFHLTEFWVAFGFAILEICIIVYSPRSTNDIYSHPIVLKIIIFFNIVSTFVPAALVSFSLKLYETPAHEFEYLNEVFVAFLNVVLTKKLQNSENVGIGNLVNKKESQQQYQQQLSKDSSVTSNKNDLKEPLLTQYQGTSESKFDSAQYDDPFDNLICQPVEQTTLNFSNHYRESRTSSSQQRNVVTPQSLNVMNVGADDSSNNSIISAITSCLNLNRYFETLGTIWSKICVFGTPALAILQILVYNEFFLNYIPNSNIGSDHGHPVILFGMTPTPLAHYLEFSFNVCSAMISFLFCMDNKLVVDQKTRDLIGSWCSGNTNTVEGTLNF